MQYPHQQKHQIFQSPSGLDGAQEATEQGRNTKGLVLEGTVLGSWK
jgi:hypothetical protein